MRPVAKSHNFFYKIYITKYHVCEFLVYACDNTSCHSGQCIAEKNNSKLYYFYHCSVFFSEKVCHD